MSSPTKKVSSSGAETPLTSRLRGAHVFVDETKRRDYLLAAAFVLPRHLDPARRRMRDLCIGDQPRVHIQKDRPARRRQLAQAIARLPVAVVIYDASAHQDERRARTMCLRRLVADLQAYSNPRLVIEQDDSLITSDRATLSQAVHDIGARSLTYEHVPPRLEPLLWIADAAAWLWDHGGDWRTRIESIVTGVTTV